ncbi:hypothetical protein JKF63_04567 [Porcisia hertigi]|uniref:Uncharacterized protein n=1 Tax=Porcisia hertigi TaxID=2761500 RepID=A0A836I0T1_9TRYP|nr:hypothetical protein JKF63_04567 [Porcisia hertigi]
MSHKGGPFKIRAEKAAVGATSASGNVVPLNASSDASSGFKGADTATGKATLSAKAFPCIRAIYEASASSSSRLAVVQRLLKSVVSTAGDVVRGTDSQRKFTSLYTEFCTSALRTLGDLEDAVYELAHPGCRAADAADSEIQGIPDSEFIKQVAAYVATHTSVLSVAYLEHVGQSALEKLQKQQQRKRGRSVATSSASAAVNSSGRAVKVSRSVAARGVCTQAAHDGGAGVGMSDGSPFDSIGLVDAHETVRNAMQSIEKRKQASACTATDAAAMPRCGDHALTPAQPDQSYTDVRPSGVFLSKGSGSLSATATSSNRSLLSKGTVAYELRNPLLKLSSIPELSPRLQPWTIPLPSSGVYLDRVTVDRDRRGGNASGNSTVEPVKAVLEVCLAPTLAEFLRQWESREAALAAEQQQSLSASALVTGSQSVVPSAGSSNRTGGLPTGGSPRSTAHLSTPPLSASHKSSSLGNHSFLLSESEACTGSTDLDPTSVLSSAFFPAVRDKWTMATMPTYVMANLSHYGVSKMEFVYSMGPPGKCQT